MKLSAAVCVICLGPVLWDAAVFQAVSAVGRPDLPNRLARTTRLNLWIRVERAEVPDRDGCADRTLELIARVLRSTGVLGPELLS